MGRKKKEKLESNVARGSLIVMGQMMKDADAPLLLLIAEGICRERRAMLTLAPPSRTVDVAREWAKRTMLPPAVTS